MKRLLPMFVLLMLTTATLASADAASEGAAPSLFDGTLAQSLATIIVFLGLFALLWKTAWGPILTGLQQRETKIKNDLESAQRASDEAKAALADYERKLAEAQAAATKIIEQGRTDAQKLSAELKAQTQTDVDQIKQRATADIHAAKEQALQAIYTQAADLATNVAGRILKRQINAADQQQLVDESLAELSKLNRN